MTPALLDLAQVHAAHMAPAESTGLLVDIDGEAVYWPCVNTAEVADLAVPAPADLAAAEDAGRILGFVHSHANGDVTPSETDRQGCEAMGLPWWIVAPPGGPWARLDPAARKLTGRQYCFGVDDCWSVCRDWYRQGFGLTLPDFVREDGFWESGFEPHLHHLEAAGFAPVERNGLRRGDGMLFRVAARTITHCAVYVGDGVMLHHMQGLLSVREQVTPAWMKRIAMIVRLA